VIFARIFSLQLNYSRAFAELWKDRASEILFSDLSIANTPYCNGMNSVFTDEGITMRNHFFIKDANVCDVAHELNELGANIGWLFVTLDSRRENFDKMSDSISAQLTTNTVSHQWSKKGLWLQNSDLVKPFVQAKIIVPFSSGYIFYGNPAELPTPSFNKTTDSGEEFSSNDLEACFSEIDRIGAAGYAADGAGLQCLFVDKRFSKCFS
jgi:hypothetical protein